MIEQGYTGYGFISMNELMVVPIISGEIPWELDYAIKQYYSYVPEQIISVTNADIGERAKHVPTVGTKKLTYAMEKYNPDLLIFHASDWIADSDVLHKIKSACMEEGVIGAGIRPWTRNGGSWHKCGAAETPHCGSIVVAYRKEIYPFVQKVKKAQPNTEVWNEAAYYACMNGWKFVPVFSRIYPVSQH